MLLGVTIAACLTAGAPQKLSETGLYTHLVSGPIDPRNRAFSPQYPLWSDGATKRRWIYLPPGKTIDAKDPELWVFPIGTRFWKEFTWDGHKVETRFLEKTGARQWTYAVYVWSQDEQEATLATPDGICDHNPIAAGVTHDIPSVVQCRACHEGSSRDSVLGFSAMQLSPDRDPLAPHAEPLQPQMVTVSTLLAEHKLVHAPPAWQTKPPTLVARSPRERAALGYLHANCWGCHNDRDEVSSVGMSLRASLQPGPEAQPALRTAVGQKSKYQLPGLAPGTSFRVAPGDLDHSALLFRVSSRNASTQMPPLGSKMIDEEALGLLRAWVSQDLQP